MELKLFLNTLRLKGYMAYEYNAFHNYQTDVDLYIVNTDIGEIIAPKGTFINKKNGLLLKKIVTNNSVYFLDHNNNTIDLEIDNNLLINNVIVVGDNDSRYKYCSNEKYAEAGSLIDLDTDLLDFDLEHPVTIEVQPSYDGSVNLILNDGKNVPRLINSRFSARQNNTYEIVDRIGENDTNIYSSKSFDKDTSLYFQYEYNPIISYEGYIQGILPVGLYCFYFTYCDADENESDYIAESGLIPIFIGNDTDPNSIDGGIKNQITDKGIKLKLSNLDKSYNYLKIYYVRYFADYNQHRVLECKKIYKKFPINSNIITLQITGNEDAEDLDANLLNITRFNPKNVLAQALCKNMLFFGNIVKNYDDYKELLDCALRIYPTLVEQSFKGVDNTYYSNTGKYGYYESKNIYNYVGYANDEYYRFGVVFIYQNGTLSNVYNPIGGDLSKDIDNNPKIDGRLYSNANNEAVLRRNYIRVDENGWIVKEDTGNLYTVTGNNLNARGVYHITYPETFESIYGILFTVPTEVLEFLKEDLGIRGLFFVRQSRMSNVLALCILFPMDTIMEAPAIPIDNRDGTIGRHYYTESYLDKDRLVVNDYLKRLILYESSTYISKKAYAAFCPDFLLNLPFFNQIFNGSSFRLKLVTENTQLQLDKQRFISHKVIDDSSFSNSTIYKKVKACTVTEDVPTVALEDLIYRLEMGETEEAYRFRYFDKDTSTYTLGKDKSDKVYKVSNLVRGKFSPYIAIYSESELDIGELYNIYRDGSINVRLEYQNRMDSSESFHAISDRYNFESLNKGEELTCWRGDCYINIFTHRLNRNFNDPSLPNNDEIIDKNTWKDNYKEDSTKWADISRADINAVQMGTWITFKVKSPYNYALRSVDHSYVSEEALMGAPRSFFPKSRLLWRGENKLPDSYLYNDAFRANLGFKSYFTLGDINYVKNSFSNRIQYSAVSIQDSFKNNYRFSLSTYFRDYSLEYGGIKKLVGFEGHILVIFEHAIGIAVINERVLSGGGDGEPVFINTANVLPEELTIISDTYGTLWPESVVKTEVGYVYGVDTIAKKIWRIKGLNIELISDFKVNKFLIDNITLGERELTPIVGLKNVKTHYNNNKKDIMFTFYDDVYKDEEKVWNLCYNEMLEEFVTFYSWVPSYSENIDTKFFSFDRNTSKQLSLLLKSNYNIPDNHGVLVNSPILDLENITNLENPVFTLEFKDVEIGFTYAQLDGFTYLKEEKVSKNLLENVKFKIEKDHWGYYDYFINSDNGKEVYFNPSKFTSKANINAFIEKIGNKAIILVITPYIEKNGGNIYFKSETIALINKSALDLNNENALKTDFYLHGQAGIFNVTEDTYPTRWYGKTHPFEFEFIVNDDILLQKIFLNLVIISNKAEPESFHFEIEGDNYEFSSDKRNMYFRQEATKNLYQNLGSDILYNRKFTDCAATLNTKELYYRASEDSNYNYSRIDKVYPIKKENLVQLVKSTIFPLYYERIDTYDDIYHRYTEMGSVDDRYDFKNLSGSEIKWNRDLNQFNIVTHIKNSPIDKVGRLRGNSFYKEGRWEVQIPSLIFNLKNESKWPMANDIFRGQDSYLAEKNVRIPPIVINLETIPDLPESLITTTTLPNIYRGNNINDYVKVGDWTYRKETKIRDKWTKIRVRYSGENLAIIHSLITIYIGSES